MLSVFITPWTKPTRIQCTINVAVRRQISGNQRPYTSGPGSPSSGKCVRITHSASARRMSSSRRAAKISKLPNRTNDGATRVTTAPGSGRGLPS